MLAVAMKTSEAARNRQSNALFCARHLKVLQAAPRRLRADAGVSSRAAPPSSSRHPVCTRLHGNQVPASLHGRIPIERDGFLPHLFPAGVMQAPQESTDAGELK